MALSPEADRHIFETLQWARPMTRQEVVAGLKAIEADQRRIIYEFSTSPGLMLTATERVRILAAAIALLGDSDADSQL